MADLPEDLLTKAEVAGRHVLQTEPRAVAVRYDAVAKLVIIDLANGCIYAFPPENVQDLRGADTSALQTVEIDGLGFNLHWPALDVDLSVPALIAGIFGTKAWITQELARIAGRTPSPAKAAAARRNGTKGGRPRKAVRQM